MSIRSSMVDGWRRLRSSSLLVTRDRRREGKNAADGAASRDRRREGKNAADGAASWFATAKEFSAPKVGAGHSMPLVSPGSLSSIVGFILARCRCFAWAGGIGNTCRLLV